MSSDLLIEAQKRGYLIHSVRGGQLLRNAWWDYCCLKKLPYITGCKSGKWVQIELLTDTIDTSKTIEIPEHMARMIIEGAMYQLPNGSSGVPSVGKAWVRAKVPVEYAEEICRVLSHIAESLTPGSDQPNDRGQR